MQFTNFKLQTLLIVLMLVSNNKMYSFWPVTIKLFNKYFSYYKAHFSCIMCTSCISLPFWPNVPTVYFKKSNFPLCLSYFQNQIQKNWLGLMPEITAEPSEGTCLAFTVLMNKKVFHFGKEYILNSKYFLPIICCFPIMTSQSIDL